MSRAFVALAALAVVVVVAVQNVISTPLREQTISRGLEGPWHVALDAAFGLLAAALVWVSLGHFYLQIAAIICAAGLVGISVTNTAWRWVDGLVGRLGGHEPVHLVFTGVVFAGAALFEIAGDLEGDGLWALSVGNLLAPLCVWALTHRQDLAEKVGVLLLCWWLFAWALLP